MLWPANATEDAWQVKTFLEIVHKEGVVVANQLGRRYVCEVCGSQVLCTKAGEGNVLCDGKEMQVQQPKALPSSDYPLRCQP